MEEKNAPFEERDIDINSDADIPGNTHLSNPVMEEDEAARLSSELNEHKEKYLRLMAEFDNYKKRTAREKVELIQTAARDTIIPLLDVLDDIDRAEKQMENINQDDAPQIIEGNKLVFTKLRNILTSRGLKVMESIGTAFDTEKHEAITQVDTNGEKKDIVLDEVEKGYYLNDKLIRFAKVVVGS